MIDREEVLRSWLDEDSIRIGDLVRVDWTKKEFKNCCSKGDVSPKNGGCPNIQAESLNNMFPHCKNKLVLVVSMITQDLLDHHDECFQIGLENERSYHQNDGWNKSLMNLWSKVGLLPNNKWVYQCGCVNDIIYGVQPIGKKEIYYADRVAVENGMSRV